MTTDHHGEKRFTTIRNPSPRPGGERPGLSACDGPHSPTIAGGRTGRTDGVRSGYVEELKDMFKIFDADESGAIDPKEIKEQMTALGFIAENETVYQLISDLDNDGSQKIEFEEFYEMMTQHMGIQRPENNRRIDIMEMFDFIDDLNPEKRDQRIDVSNLEKIARVLGDDISREELEVMITGADRTGKGYVSADDFYELMVSCTQRIDTQEVAIGTAKEGHESSSPSFPDETPTATARRHSLDLNELRRASGQGTAGTTDQDDVRVEPLPTTPKAPLRSSLMKQKTERKLERKITLLVGHLEDPEEDET